MPTVFCMCLCAHKVGSGALEKEEEFVQKCMESLSAASSQLEQVFVAEKTYLDCFLLTCFKCSAA